MIYASLGKLYDKFYFEITIIFIGLILIGLGVLFYKNRYKWISFHSKGYMKKILHDRERYVKESSNLWIVKSVLITIFGVASIAIGIYFFFKYKNNH